MAEGRCHRRADRHMRIIYHAGRDVDRVAAGVRESVKRCRGHPPAYYAGRRRPAARYDGRGSECIRSRAPRNSSPDAERNSLTAEDFRQREGERRDYTPEFSHA